MYLWRQADRWPSRKHTGCDAPSGILAQQHRGIYRVELRTRSKDISNVVPQCKVIPHLVRHSGVFSYPM